MLGNSFYSWELVNTSPAEVGWEGSKGGNNEKHLSDAIIVAQNKLAPEEHKQRHLYFLHAAHKTCVHACSVSVCYALRVHRFVLTMKRGIEVHLCASVCVCVCGAPCTECNGIQTTQSHSDKGAHGMLGVLAPTRNNASIG